MSCQWRQTCGTFSRTIFFEKEQLDQIRQRLGKINDISIIPWKETKLYTKARKKKKNPHVIKIHSKFGASSGEHVECFKTRYIRTLPWPQISLQLSHIVSLIWLAYFRSHAYFSYIDSLGFLFIKYFSLTKGLRSRRSTLLSMSEVHQPFYISIY